MTNIKSRTDHTYMVRKGRGRRRSDPSRKRVQMYVWHRLCVTLTLRMPDATKLVAVSFRLSEKLTLRILIATKVVAEWRIDPSNICCYQSGSNRHPEGQLGHIFCVPHTSAPSFSRNASCDSPSPSWSCMMRGNWSARLLLFLMAVPILSRSTWLHGRWDLIWPFQF